MNIGHTKEDRINTVYGGGGHVVILGAGASVAATHFTPLKDNKQLPLMKNFVEIVGLSDIFESYPNITKSDNFEELYSTLFLDDPSSNKIKELERRVYDYFKNLKLPDVPTIYDYLVLSLRPRDLIATFNWDPFLYQAWTRNYHIGDRPYTAFLHGSVALGYSEIDKRWGPAGLYSKETGNYMTPTKLLFPVTQKNYYDDEFTSTQWDMFKDFLSDENVKRVTIFGYGAPETDVEAMKIMLDAWGGGKVRRMESFEIIDVRNKEEVIKPWKKFISDYDYDFTTNFFKSSIANNPRRTSESYFQHTQPLTEDEAWSESNPVPSNFNTLKAMWDWFKPLIDAETKWKEDQDNGNQKSSS